jgi:hypothetical protein
MPNSSNPAISNTLSQTLNTPANIKEIEVLFNRVFQGNPSIDPLALDQLKKLQKGAFKAIANAET